MGLRFNYIDRRFRVIYQICGTKSELYQLADRWKPLKSRFKDGDTTSFEALYGMKAMTKGILNTEYHRKYLQPSDYVKMKY